MESATNPKGGRGRGEVSGNPHTMHPLSHSLIKCSLCSHCLQSCAHDHSSNASALAQGPLSAENNHPSTQIFHQFLFLFLLFFSLLLLFSKTLQKRMCLSTDAWTNWQRGPTPGTDPASAPPPSWPLCLTQKALKNHRIASRNPSSPALHE